MLEDLERSLKIPCHANEQKPPKFDINSIVAIKACPDRHLQVKGRLYNLKTSKWEYLISNNISNNNQKYTPESWLMPVRSKYSERTIAPIFKYQEGQWVQHIMSKFVGRIVGRILSSNEKLYIVDVRFSNKSSNLIYPAESDISPILQA